MELHALDDRQLFERVAQGANDAATWRAFVDRFSRLCYHAIYRILARHAWTTPGDGDELFQRLFAYILGNDRAALRRYRGENGCSPGTWMAHLAAFQALEFIREREHAMRGLARSEEEHDQLERTTGSKEPAADERLERTESILRLRKAIEHLSPSDRYFYNLVYEQELPLVEVAKLLAKTETAVHVQHFRLKERLRKHLEAGTDAAVCLE